MFLQMDKQFYKMKVIEKDSHSVTLLQLRSFVFEII